MTGEAFIKELDKKGYSYEIEGDRIIVNWNWHVYLNALTSLPPGVVFKNKGVVYLDSLTSLPRGVVFNNKGVVNGGGVNLRSLTSLPPGVVFRNEGRVYLDSLTSLPPDVEFRNRGYIKLKSLMGGYFDDWKGNIEGIDNKRLLHVMIKQGVFER